MKLKFERFNGISCFYVRGPVDATRFKILKMGLDTLLAQQEEDLILHFGLAIIAQTEVPALLEYKKKRKKGGFDLHWISKEKGIGDFPALELFASRNLTNQMRSIGVKIKLDDDVYALTEETTLLEDKIKFLGGNAENAKKILTENEMMKNELRVLTQAKLWHLARIESQKFQISAEEDLPEKLKQLEADFKKQSEKVMSSKVKPDPLTTEQIAALSLELEKKKQALESSIVVLRDKAHRIEVSLKENEHIRQQVQELFTESLSYFQTEWTRKSEYYPEIRASILQKAIDSKGKA